MNCETCINRHSPFQNGYCRTMTKRPKKLECHMTKEQALKVERDILKVCGNDEWAKYTAKKQIKFLEGLEG